MKIEDLPSKQLKGFLADNEAFRLYELSKEAAKRGPCLEIGSYCGKSSAYLGIGCQESGGILFSIDHHRGSEEQQPGQEYFDPELLDKETGLIDTFKIFRKAINDLALQDTVIPIVAPSSLVARCWSIPLSLVFIDGGHTFDAAFNDYNSWSSHLIAGGFLVIHDIFPDPTKGGQAPHSIYHLALASGLYTAEPITDTLGVLKRIQAGQRTKEADEIWHDLNNPR